MIDDNKASYDEIKRKLKAKKKELESKYKAATEKLFYTNESKALFISFEDLKEFAISNNIKILPSFNDSLILYWVLETGVKVPFHYHDCEESIFIIKGNVLFEKKEQDQPLLISCKDGQSISFAPGIVHALSAKEKSIVVAILEKPK